MEEPKAITWTTLPQNVVMLMSDIVDWLIPDIPKDISVQIHKEKILLVELFMKEEQGKIRNLESRLSAGDKEKHNQGSNSTGAHPRPEHHNISLES